MLDALLLPINFANGNSCNKKNNGEVISMPEQKNSITRRDFVRSGVRGAFLLSLGGGVGHTHQLKKTVGWKRGKEKGESTPF